MTDQLYPFQNPQLNIEERVADLLGRMTLSEKAAQLYGLGLMSPEDENGLFSLSKARSVLKHGVCYVNSFHQERGTRQTAEFLNAVQGFLRDETRLGIPALGIGEALHGYMAHEATSFPQAIGLAATWDPALAEAVFSAAAYEMRVRGAHFALSPVLDLARDPRWGRTEETYGEDPHLAAQMGVAAVRGLQGRTQKIDGEHVLATAKHFAVHGGPEGGTNAAPGNYAERIVREQFLLPFQAAVEQGGVRAVMASYNEINGIPSHINPWLLKDVLRGEWGFDGLVVSDGWGVDDLYRLHRVALDAADAARQAFLAGVDIELGHCFEHLVDEVNGGRVPEALIDQAVSQVLRYKFELGLFENPFVDPEAAAAITNQPGHRELALQAARKVLTLLKNEGDILPLDIERLQTLTVIGPNAAAVRLGGYSGNPIAPVSILDGIRAYAGERIQVTYAEGCKITDPDLGPRQWFEDHVGLPDPDEDTMRIEQAVELAGQADAVLLVLGDNEGTCREGWSENHLGDRDTLDLPGRQDELLRAVAALGKTTILLLIHGRPATINFAVEHVDAILEGWYLGEQGGTAVAEVLFGDTNPGGKLPVTFPRSTGQIPAYYYHKPSARRGYLFTSVEPLFPFGHGLSYTQFEYSNLRIEPQRIQPGESARLWVDVSNTGARPGDEVVQYYLRDQVSSLTRPVLELKGFQRITLQPGETQTVTFEVSPQDLSFLGMDMQPVIEPGFFDLIVGGSSRAANTVVLEVAAS